MSMRWRSARRSNRRPQLGFSGQRHGCWVNRVDFTCSLAGAHCLRQAQDIQLIAGIESQVERLLMPKSWQAWPLQPHCVPSPRHSPAETARGARWWTGLSSITCARPTARGSLVCRPGFANRDASSSLWEALHHSASRPDRSTIAGRAGERSLPQRGRSDCGTGVEQPASNTADERAGRGAEKTLREPPARLALVRSAGK